MLPCNRGNCNRQGNVILCELEIFPFETSLLQPTEVLIKHKTEVLMHDRGYNLQVHSMVALFHCNDCQLQLHITSDSCVVGHNKSLVENDISQLS